MKEDRRDSSKRGERDWMREHSLFQNPLPHAVEHRLRQPALFESLQRSVDFAHGAATSVDRQGRDVKGIAYVGF